MTTTRDVLAGLGLVLGSVAAASLTGRRAAASAEPDAPGGVSLALGGGGPPVVISTYAGGIDWWPGARPALIDWQGVRASPAAHPSWSGPADALRGPDGRLLPALLRKYGHSSASRVACIGFSAGSNSGLGQLLKHPLDRAQIDFVGSFDGIHGYVGQYPPPAGNPLAYFKYRDQADPWFDFMRQAALGLKGCVVTASNVAPPAADFTQTRIAVTSLLQALGTQLGRLSAGDTPWTSPPLMYRPGDAALPAATLEQVRASWGTITTATMGQLNALTAPNGDQKEDHVKQARMIGPLMLATLVPRWRAGGQV